MYVLINCERDILQLSVQTNIAMQRWQATPSTIRTNCGRPEITFCLPGDEFRRSDEATTESLKPTWPSTNYSDCC